MACFHLRNANHLRADCVTAGLGHAYQLRLMAQHCLPGKSMSGRIRYRYRTASAKRLAASSAILAEFLVRSAQHRASSAHHRCPSCERCQAV